ncbi:MAG: hypothetical protein WC277_10980, partial [Bacilli bacterium]
AKSKPTPPRERVFGGEVFELWTGEYGPEAGGHTKARAQQYAEILRRAGTRARVVPYGGSTSCTSSDLHVQEK